MIEKEMVSQASNDRALDAKYIAIDMGGTRTKIGYFCGDRLEKFVVVPSHSQDNFEGTIRTIHAAIKALTESLHVTSIDGIGLSLPGIINTKENKVVSINDKFVDAVAFDLNRWTEETWNCRLVTENDARAALTGEWREGAGKGTDNLVMITLGTGIGGAALIEGKLLHGKHFQAGCLGGHFSIDFRGEKCNCGNRGCAESKGSSWILPTLAATGNYPVEGVSFEKLFKDMRNGNKEATDILHFCIDAWSACAVNLIHAYDPEMVIIGGGVMKSADLILPEIQAWVNEYAWTPWGKVSVKKAELEDTAALYGMNYLLKEPMK
ncbi:MAG: Beta-glucoside kinase [Candidatus Ordinivivax streblomastigis]|uniref:Beta-glucoside kinase n=1 Tax=Candidatus Ordinivivax streblomastigis TaxID=2540710 RepID=A0A5M8NVG0_9BACT|nr:MAG: Beta-glucoside kinase [Candidatus Ordinivivax streblomastigis]